MQCDALSPGSDHLVAKEHRIVIVGTDHNIVNSYLQHLTQLSVFDPRCGENAALLGVLTISSVVDAAAHLRDEVYAPTVPESARRSNRRASKHLSQSILIVSLRIRP
jgi:hypothetical protein